MNKEIIIKIDPITDFFVGSNEKYTPFDYVQEKGKFIIYDFLEMLRDLDISEDKVKKVILQIEESKRNKRYEISFFDLAKTLGVVDIEKYERHIFDSDLLSEKYSEFEIFPSYNFYDGEKSNSFFYIPGSSIKGAFKTAVESIILRKKISQIKNVSKNELRNLEKEIKNEANQFFKEDGKIPNVIFNDIEISDCDCFIVKEQKRLMKTSEKGQKPKYTLSKLGVVQNLKKDFYYEGTIISTEKFLLKVFKIANEFTKNVISAKVQICEEIQTNLEKGVNHLVGKRNEIIDSYIDNLNRLYKKVESASNYDCYLFLGKFKGFFENSFGSIILEEKGFDVFDKYRKESNLGKKMGKFGKVFPSTITMTEDYNPIGLVKISFENE